MGTLIPTPYKYLAILLLFAAYTGFIYLQGLDKKQDEWNASIQKDNIAVLTKTVIQKEITVQNIIKYVDKIKTVKEKGNEIVREVPVYVTKKDDDMCTINAGFVSLLDRAANQDAIPGAAKPINESTTKAKVTFREGFKY